MNSWCRAPKGDSQSHAESDRGTARRSPAGVRALFIDVRVEGFFLERFNGRGELVGTTQHETMDEAMWQAYSEYEIAEWRSCPGDVDPVQYIRTQSER
jgi:hypothetical protein